MFELNVKSYIKRNPRLRQAKMGMLMSKWAWNRKVCPRQFKRFFSSFTLPKTSALCPSGEVRPSSGRACLVSLCPK